MCLVKRLETFKGKDRSKSECSVVQRRVTYYFTIKNKILFDIYIDRAEPNRIE